MLQLPVRVRGPRKDGQLYDQPGTVPLTRLGIERPDLSITKPEIALDISTPRRLAKSSR